MPLVHIEIHVSNLKVTNIDGARVNGKFVVGTKAIPKGQAALHYLLNQCYSMLAALLANNVPVSVKKYHYKFFF